MEPADQGFYRIKKLPPYVFAVINEMKAKARAAQLDVVDLGMGNPDGATPRPIVSKLVEAARNPRNHRYSASRGIPPLRVEIVKRYQANYGVTRNPHDATLKLDGSGDPCAATDPGKPLRAAEAEAGGLNSCRPLTRNVPRKPCSTIRTPGLGLLARHGLPRYRTEMRISFLRR